jgi:hypothetical protein
MNPSLKWRKLIWHVGRYALRMDTIDCGACGEMMTPAQPAYFPLTCGDTFDAQEVHNAIAAALRIDKTMPLALCKQCAYAYGKDAYNDAALWLKRHVAAVEDEMRRAHAILDAMMK